MTALNVGARRYRTRFPCDLVDVLGSNVGSSRYDAMNVRLEHRFTNGFTFTGNYTLSRLTDNVGGPEADYSVGLGAAGLGQKIVQSVDSPQQVYGLSPLDQTNRLTLGYTY